MNSLLKKCVFAILVIGLGIAVWFWNWFPKVEKLNRSTSRKITQRDGIRMTPSRISDVFRSKETNNSIPPKQVEDWHPSNVRGFFTPDEFKAMLPFLVGQIVESSRTGDLYVQSNVRADAVAVVIPARFAAQFGVDLEAELLNGDEQSLAKWIVWEYVFSFGQPSTDDFWSCPAIAKKDLEKTGLIINLFQTIDGQCKVFARVPIYPYQKGLEFGVQQ